MILMYFHHTEVFQGSSYLMFMSFLNLITKINWKQILFWANLPSVLVVVATIYEANVKFNFHKDIRYASGTLFGYIINEFRVMTVLDRIWAIFVWKFLVVQDVS